MFRIPLSFKKLTVTATVGTLAATGLLAAAPGAAQADSGYVRIAPRSNPFLYLDVSGGSTGDGAKIIQWSLSGDNQVWYFHETGGYFEIINKRSGKCITTDGVAGHQLYQWVCTGIDRQLWSSSHGTPQADTGNVPFVNIANNLSMDVSGGSGSQGAAIIGWPYSGGSNQRFNVMSAS